MAKGLRCKTKRAFRAVKRQHVSATVEASRLEALHHRLKLVQQGQDAMAIHKRPLNKFLHPDAEDAEYPQKAPGPPPLDFRSEALPLAGLVGRGQRKKFADEEKMEMMSLFNCLPGRTEGPIVREAREALRRKEALGAFDMGGDDEQQQIIMSSSAAAGEEGGGEMVADDAAAEAVADLRRQKVPVVTDRLKQRAAQRPQGIYRAKGR